MTIAPWPAAGGDEFKLVLRRNKTTLAALCTIGVDYAQGYGVQKPLPMGAAGISV